MKLKKRNCPINIELDPYGIDILDISMDICGKHYDFTASSVIGDRFDVFLCAIYGMYREAPGKKHYYSHPRSEAFKRIDDYIIARFFWDSEGTICTFSPLKTNSYSPFRFYPTTILFVFFKYFVGIG